MAAITPPEFDPSEYVSGIAVDVLDELRMRVVECRLVLEVLPWEADLNFDELECLLRDLQQEVDATHEAASLVRQGAALGGSWATGWSRPRGIFARHNAAVRQGAAKIRPEASFGERLERDLWQLPPLDRSQDAASSRPTCAGTVRATGKKCGTKAVYLGAGTFGAHCYSHATPAEREQYRAHSDVVAARQATSQEDLRNHRRRLGERIMENWLQDRSNRAE